VKCFSAFSILSAFGAAIAWGLFSIISAGIFRDVMIAIAVPILGMGAIAAIIWAFLEAVSCIQDWRS
jgi:hypothetical protein